MEQYTALDTALRGAPAPPERLVFAVGPRDGGLQVLQVWESRAGLESFNERWLFPALAELGPDAFPAPPMVIDFETHDLVISS